MVAVPGGLVDPTDAASLYGVAAARVYGAYGAYGYHPYARPYGYHPYARRYGYHPYYRRY